MNVGYIIKLCTVLVCCDSDAVGGERESQVLWQKKEGGMVYYVYVRVIFK